MASSSRSLPPPSGSWRNTSLAKVYYGPDCLLGPAAAGQHGSSIPPTGALVSAMQNDLGRVHRRAFVITGQSLSTKTDVITRIVTSLKEQSKGELQVVQVYDRIGQHAPVAGIEEATRLIDANQADVLVAIGGGSPIDAAKAISYFYRDEQQTAGDESAAFLPIIAVPTTLSVAETTSNAGFTSSEGHKVGVNHPSLFPRVIIYDAALSLHTPQALWLSTGIRALDHAIETLYRPLDSALQRPQCLLAVRDLFTYLPACARDPASLRVRQRLFLAAFHSLAPETRLGALGLSHALGHKIGATYALPHGRCSCATLARTIRHVATSSSSADSEGEQGGYGQAQRAALAELASFLPPPYAPQASSLGPGAGASVEELDAPSLAERGVQVSEAVQRLVDDLGLRTRLGKDARLDAYDGGVQAQLESIARRTVGEGASARRYEEVMAILRDIA